MVGQNELRLLRIWVTEGCNAFCSFCMNANARSNAHMSYDKAKIMFEYFRENGINTVSIMGGEPTIHPEIIRITKLAQSIFPSVYIFTNSIKSDVLQSFDPRDEDIIVYNFNFSKHISKDSLLLNKPGKRLLDVVIDSKSNVSTIVEELIRVSSYSPDRLQINLTLNNSTNIFLEKEQTINNINYVYNKISAISYAKIEFQCSAPICFTYGENLPPFNYNSICPEKAVLVDASFNVCFCNINTNDRINLFVGDNIIPFKLLTNHLKKYSLRNRLEALNKICSSCLFYDIKCNGKCHISQEIISTQDIQNNTKIPWLKKNIQKE